MTSYQESYEKMSNSTTSFLTANATITATLPGFTNYLPVIQTTLAQIMAAKVLQESDKKGNTKSKNLFKSTLISQAIDVDRRVVAYATNVGNVNLLESVNYSESDLKKSSDSNLVSICQVIRDNANANVAALATYGVTAAVLSTLQTSISNFNTALPKGRVGTTDSEEATNLLNMLFKTLTSNWAKIDTLVEMVHTAQPNFYNEYKNVRKIIVMGTNSLVLKIKASNVQTGNPEANVTLTLTPSNGQLKSASRSSKNTIVKKTAEGGCSNYKNVPDGIYMLVAKKPGFRDVIETISVVNGEMNVVEIKMEKV